MKEALEDLLSVYSEAYLTLNPVDYKQTDYVKGYKTALGVVITQIEEILNENV